MSASAAAWTAWRDADFTRARELADLAVNEGEGDTAHHVRCLTAHVTGDHAAAIAAHEAVSPRYRRLAELDGPVLWSYLRRRDVAGAWAFAQGRGLLRDRALVEQLRLAARSPLSVELAGVSELDFVDDALTPCLPGVGVRINGHAAVARLDTGGAWLHMTESQARRFGVAFGGKQRAFASLRRSSIQHGAAELALGAAVLRNVPVIVHEDGAISNAAISRTFGVELGPVIGTNVFAQFLSTIDAPAARLILSPRADEHARRAHLARVPGAPEHVPFVLLTSHYLLARGGLGGARSLTLFVDSGVAAYNPEQGQAALLASEKTLDAWQAARPRGGRFTDLPGPIRLGPLERAGLTALAVPERTWRGFGTWLGIGVDALLSHGFLKAYAWTLDFEQQLFQFRAPASNPASLAS